MQTNSTKNLTAPMLVLPAIGLFILGLGCLNEGDVMSTIVSFSLSFVLFIALWFTKEPEKPKAKNIYIPEKYNNFNPKWSEADYNYSREPYDCQDDPEQNI